MQFQTDAAMARVNGLNKTTLGALLAAILVVLFLISRYLPVIGTVAMFFCPVPLVIMHVKFGDLKYTALVALVATALVSIYTGNPMTAVFFLISVGLQGMVLAFMIGARKSAITSVFVCALTTTISITVSFVVVSSVMEFNVSVKKQLEVISEQFKKSGDANIESLKKSGASAEQIGNMERFYVQAAEAIRGMYVYVPLSLLASSFMSAIINYLAAAMVLRRFKYEAAGLPAFSRWRMPWKSVWVFIAGLLLLNLSGGEEQSGTTRYLHLIGLNINGAFMMLFFINGLAVVHFYLIHYSVNMAARIFLYFLIFFHPLFYMTVLFVGLADPWIDIRKIDEQNNLNEGGLDK